MRKKDTLQLLSPIYFIGLSIENDCFSSKARNTARLAKEIRFFGGDEITVLYSITSRNSDVVWDFNQISEIHIFQIPVPVRNLRRDVIRNIARAIQRGIPYQTIIILSNNQWYKVVTTKWHRGKTDEISVVDEVYSSKWMDTDDLRSFFSEFRSNLELKCKIKFSNLWRTLLRKMNRNAHDLDDPLAIDDEYSPVYFYNDATGIGLLLKTLGIENIEQILYDELNCQNSSPLYCDYEEDDVQTHENDDSDSLYISQIMDRLKQCLDEDTFYLIKDGMLDWLSGIRKEDLIALIENYSEYLQFAE